MDARRCKMTVKQIEQKEQSNFVSDEVNRDTPTIRISLHFPL